MDRGVFGVELACSDMWSEESKYTGEKVISEKKRVCGCNSVSAILLNSGK